MIDPDRRLVLASAACAALAAMLPAAAHAASDRLDPAAMRRDIDLLYDAYTSLHPGLYRYLTPAALLEQRRRLDACARTPQSLGDFYLALSAFTASIRCGHSFPNPVNQSAAVTRTLFDRADRLPFAFSWLDGRMIVIRDPESANGWAPGTEIVSIDGIDTASC